MLTLILLPQVPTAPRRPADRSSARPVREWVEPRYAELAITWDMVQPPPGWTGFVYARA